MRRSDLPNSDDSGSELDGAPRCSTTRKQQKHLEKSQGAEGIHEDQEEDVAAVCPANPVCEPEPECAPVPACALEQESALVPVLSNRRKQSNPFRRAQRFKREVRLLQRTPNFMISRISFCRVVRQIMMEKCGCEPHFRITMGALEALQTATEMFLTQRFQDSYMLTMHRQRVTLEQRDMALMAFICGLHGLL